MYRHLQHEFHLSASFLAWDFFFSPLQNFDLVLEIHDMDFITQQSNLRLLLPPSPTVREGREA